MKQSTLILIVALAGCSQNAPIRGWESLKQKSMHDLMQFTLASRPGVIGEWQWYGDVGDYECRITKDGKPLMTCGRQGGEPYVIPYSNGKSQPIAYGRHFAEDFQRILMSPYNQCENANKSTITQQANGLVLLEYPCGGETICDPTHNYRIVNARFDVKARGPTQEAEYPRTIIRYDVKYAGDVIDEVDYRMFSQDDEASSLDPVTVERLKVLSVKKSQPDTRELPPELRIQELKPQNLPRIFLLGGLIAALIAALMKLAELRRRSA